jgi:methylated-DNA-[protein]-cysteine S-methyltransferase
MTARRQHFRHGAISKRRLLSIEGTSRMPGKTLFDVLLPVAPPRPHP